MRVNSAGLATSLTNQIGSPADLATDSAGNVPVADHDNSRIVKLDQSGNLSVVVGGSQLAISSCGYSQIGTQSFVPLAQRSLGV